MRIAYLDCVGGLSGDMFVGALLDAGWPEDSFRRGVAWLNDEIAELRIEQRTRHSLVGKGIVVVPRDTRSSNSRRDSEHLISESDHGRGLAQVLSIIRHSPLPGKVLERASEIFERLAAAEARAHGIAIDKVHFHEVGATDALVDICSACLGIHELGIERLYVSPLPIGGGMIETEHGRLPLPAPAATYLLESAPVRWLEVAGERCTPTGAALAAALGRWAMPPAMRIARIGCGAGERDFADVPNIVRLFVGDESASDTTTLPFHTAIPAWGWSDSGAHGCPGTWAQVVTLETQLDDTTPEETADLAQRLRDGGALEVFEQPIVMKKNRLATKLTAIARLDREEALAAIILRGSATLGVRRLLQWRRELARREGEVVTPFGPVKVKLAWRGDRWVGKPEYESCRRIAAAAGVELADVRRAALAVIGPLEAAEPAPLSAEDHKPL